jgi:hypothetical protein
MESYNFLMQALFAATPTRHWNSMHPSGNVEDSLLQDLKFKAASVFDSPIL